MEEIFVKLLLSVLVAAPFVALATDVSGKSDGLMPRVLIGVTIVVALALLLGGFQQRPRFVNFVFGAFLVWPVLLLVGKAVKPALSWSSMGFSVPLMSWTLVNLMVGMTDGAALRGVIALLFG